jgi:hypothetical protein
MRIVRLFVVLAVAMITALLSAPGAVADPPFRLQTAVTDNAGVLSESQKADVTAAVDKLFDDRRIKLWVVYVKSFDGQNWMAWSDQTMKISDFGDADALLAIATVDRSFAFRVPTTATGGTSTLTDSTRRDGIEPALRKSDWAGAAIAAATGLNASPQSGPHISGRSILIALAALVLLAVLLWWWLRSRRSRRRKDEFEAAKRVDPTDPGALAAVPLEALDELSKLIVVDVDNAVRTSAHELELAVEEFGTARTGPFSTAVANAKTTLAQAFNARQILDDSIPETPLQRRDLLTRVIVAAANADRELEAQQDAFSDLRNLVINAPDRLDSMTRQMVALTARVEPARQTLTALHQQFAESALASVADNVEEAQHRLTFADQNITSGRKFVTAPSTDQTTLIDTIRSAEAALQQSQTLLDAVDSAATDINRAITTLPSAIDDIQNGIDTATALLQNPDTPQVALLRIPRQAAVEAVTDAKSDGGADPLGTFIRLTKADSDLDRVLENLANLRAEAEKQARVLEQALFAAQSRVNAVSEFIDTRRGSIGPEARTRLAEAVRQLNTAQAKKTSDRTEAIQHANGAAALAAQAQSLANDDVRSAQVSYAPHYSRQSDIGSVIGGIIIGNVLRGGLGGGWGGWGGGMGGGRSPGQPTSYGGSSNSSGRSYGGGGGRF